MDYETSAQVVKVDEKLGLVFGWAVVCEKDGEPYYDLQEDNIPESVMLKAATDFMVGDRIAGDMHQRTDAGEPVQDGTVVFLWPLTKDIAEAMGLVTKQTGLMIGIKPSADVLAKFASGEFKGFSIGGLAGREAVAE